MKLIGKLRCYAYCVRPGRYFLRRLTNFAHYHRGLDTPMPLSAEFHLDLAMWREIVSDPDLKASRYSTPLYNHLRRSPELLVIGDAMADAGGGFVAGAGVEGAPWWRVQWPSAVVERFLRTSMKQEPKATAVTIAHLELATLVIGVATMLDQASSGVGKAVLALADNTNTVAWAQRAGARDRRAAALVRLLGVEEAKHRFSLASKHIPGVENEEADFISRHGVEEVRAYLIARPLPPLAAGAWRQVAPPSELTNRVLSILSSTM